MISIDIETTGLDPKKHQILEFAAVLENGYAFTATFKYDDYVIGPYCMKLHEKLLPICETQGVSINDLGTEFSKWLRLNGISIPYDVVGANFAGFDAQFLKRVPNFPLWNYRICDIGNLYFDGVRPVSLHKAERSKDAHRAFEDAEAVMRAYKRKVAQHKAIKDFVPRSEDAAELLALINGRSMFDFGNGFVRAHRHSNGDGWVADTATVDESAFVGSNAQVFHTARVLDKARVSGYAKVCGEAAVIGRAVVSNALVSGTSVVRDNAKILKDAVIQGDTIVQGDAMFNQITLNTGLFGFAQ